MTLIIDNYDSFSYNIFQIVGEMDPDVKIIKNDDFTIEEIKQMNPKRIIISSGSGRPINSGISKAVVEHFKDSIPILGICLGHHAICEVFGAKIVYAKTIMHGKTSNIHIANGSPIFKSLSPILIGARYHSLMVERETLPDELLVIAEDDDNSIMGIKHQDFNVYGLQFHPESMFTQQGHDIIANFLNIDNRDI